MWTLVAAAGGLIWYCFIVAVIAIGTFQLYIHFSRPVPKPVSPTLPLENVPHITIIRPAKGVEPYLYECLASTFVQNYPASKLSIAFCVSSPDDPAYPVLTKLIDDFPGYDAQIYVEREDPLISVKHGRELVLGPNPKIRNMSRAYREAKGDIVWIVDCNVWVSRSVAGLMVDTLCGFAPASKGRKYKFVHQLPLAVDVSVLLSQTAFDGGATASSQSQSSPLRTTTGFSLYKRVRELGGGLLEELFMSTSHAKFYTAISTVAVAPCTVGKSNMFRRSHLDTLTKPSPHNDARSPGIDFFSDNICEDHLIGDLLWKTPVPEAVLRRAAREGLDAAHNTSVSSSSHQRSKSGGSVLGPGIASNAANAFSWGNHALLRFPPCVQPVEHVSLGAYAARRARWLRVRKFTVPAATLVEPGTESLLATAYAAFGLTTLPYFREQWGVPPTWAVFLLLWIVGVSGWMAWDWAVSRLLHQWAGEGSGDDRHGNGVAAWSRAGSNAAINAATPPFVGSGARRPFRQWALGWLGREMLALPVWAWAVLGGTTVLWRGRRFWVGTDMRVHEILDEEKKTV